MLVIHRIIFGNKSNVSKEDVLEYLKRMQSGEIDEYWWDDFLNVPIKNEELESIRERCDVIWDFKSEFLSQKDKYYLNKSGIAEITKLIERCENVAPNK